MIHFSRRGFLKQIGILGTGLLISPALGSSQQVLAQPTRRKLALLVGLNQYQRFTQVPPLKGCLTDIELYQELFIHRFGFNPQDILVLTDELATRSNIETAFLSHILNQVQTDDVVAFVFCGYGCLARTETASDPAAPTARLAEQQVLLPADGWVPARQEGQPPLFNGLYEDTVQLLLRSLPTDKIVTILDVGRQSDRDLLSRGVRDRSLPVQDLSAAPPAEVAFQERLLKQTQLTREQLQIQRRSNQTPGLLLSASALGSAALEIDYTQFSAGLFSLALTQQLWTATPATSVTIPLGYAANRMCARSGPSTRFAIRGQKSFGALPWDERSRLLPAGVGVVELAERRGQSGRLWLGGLPTRLLDAYQAKSCFYILDPSPLLTGRVEPAPETEPAETEDQPTTDTEISPNIPIPLPDLPDTLGTIQMRSRRGLTAVAQTLSGMPLREGQLLQEWIRVLPKQLALRIGLGSNLERVERVDATSLFSMEKQDIQVVGANKPADFLFVKVQDPPSAEASPKESGKAAHRYGLAYLNGELLPNTTGDRGEVVKLAIQRLLPNFDVLLAMKLLELTVNDFASQLRVSVTLEQLDDPPTPLQRRSTPGTPNWTPGEAGVPLTITKSDKSGSVVSFSGRAPIQYRVVNWNPFPIYGLFLGLDSGTNFFSSYITESPSNTPDRKPMLKSWTIQAESVSVFPAGSVALQTLTTPGLTRGFMLFSTQPLTQTLDALSANLRSPDASAAGTVTKLNEPLSVVQTLLGELDALSREQTDDLDLDRRTTWAISTHVWAALPNTYVTV